MRGISKRTRRRWRRYLGRHEDELRKSMRVLSKIVSTVFNTMLRDVCVDGKTATVLPPFARTCTSGCVCRNAMQYCWPAG